jgi:hypothetical protein
MGGADATFGTFQSGPPRVPDGVSSLLQRDKALLVLLGSDLAAGIAIGE